MSTISDAEKQQAQDQKAQALQQQYNRYQETMTELQTQLSTLSAQIQEHSIVDKSLIAIPPNKRDGRKCFKMVGGVLVEKTIDEVIQMLDKELKELNEQKAKVEKTTVATRKEMESWMKTNNVKIIRGDQ